MTSDKKLCASIMLCQMTAILSGVALLYLAVIVVIPSKKELELGFLETPIMCTTVKAEDINLRIPTGDTKEECTWGTCGEWCLSKGTACMQIHVAARKNSSKVTFHDCVDVYDKQCSGLDVNLTQPWKCKKGQCANLSGLFNCSRDGLNVCREITAAFECRNKKISEEKVTCLETCDERLDGVYSCKKGECYQVKEVNQYWKDCQRKCTKLLMKDRNTVIFSKERMIAANCKKVSSSTSKEDNNTITDINSDPGWINLEKVVFLFCTYYKEKIGESNYDLHLEDCFNGTMGEAEIVENFTDYRDILAYHKELTARPNAELLIHTEESLGIMNVTKLLINTEGCSNTLSKECDKFFATHANDGLDGKTADRFPCYYTEKDSSFVVGQYNPRMTFIFLLLASTIPSGLFVFACFVLFLCSKSVGVNDEGHLVLTLFKGSGAGGKFPLEISLGTSVLCLLARNEINISSTFRRYFLTRNLRMPSRGIIYAASDGSAS